jgi:hypothetical protein
VIIGGVLGPITRPDVVIVGLYRGDDLVVVGRTVPLHPRQAAELVPLDPHLGQLLDQPLFLLLQLDSASDDPLQHHGIRHRGERRSRVTYREPEPPRTQAADGVTAG